MLLLPPPFKFCVFQTLFLTIKTFQTTSSLHQSILKSPSKKHPTIFSLICPKNPLQKPQKMPKKRSPILKKALGFFTLSIPMEKLKRPINRDLLFFKKTRKIRTLKFLKHHSYIEEYQFSPSSTPLSKNSRISLKKRSRQGLYSMLLLCHCSGNSSSEEGEEERDRLDAPIDFDEMGSEPKSLGLSEEEEEEEEEEADSIDKRAEKFIETFYEEMRMQRQQSALEYTQMLDRSSG